MNRTTLHAGNLQRAHAMLPVLEERPVSGDDDRVIEEPHGDLDRRVIRPTAREPTH